MRSKSRSDCEPLRCSFCRKSQAAVGKLISNPSDYPSAYICVECVAICAAIIEDDQENSDPVVAAESERHSLLSHPLASELMVSVAQWIRQEALGHDPSEELERVRTIAARLIASAGG